MVFQSGWREKSPSARALFDVTARSRIHPRDFSRRDGDDADVLE